MTRRPQKRDILIQQRAEFGFRRSCSGLRGGGSWGSRVFENLPSLLKKNIDPLWLWSYVKLVKQHETDINQPNF